jgi:hypothetical protein
MGARPPTDDIDDEPTTVEFGIAALEARIERREVSFPVSVAELEEVYGDMRVPVDPAGNEVALGRVLEKCNRVEFDSKQEMLNVLHPIFEAERESGAGSIFGRLRSLVPF